MKVAVIGSTGYVGGRLVPELLAAGHDIRCLARNPDRLAGVDWRPDVEVMAADVLDKESLDAALSGIEAVYYLVHAMGHAGDFEQTDRLGAENTRTAAERAGVSRIVYLGGLGEDDRDHLSTHLASRHEVGHVLAAGTVPVTELRAAVIIGSGSASFEMLRHLDEVLPAMICPRWVTKTQCQPIAIADVLHYLVAVIDKPETAGQILEIGGPDVLTYRDMMDRYAAIAGLRKRLIIPVPLLTPRLSSHWVNLVTPLPYGLARPLVDSLINDVVVHPERDIRRFIDHEPHTLDEAIRRALAVVGDLAIKTSWMDSAPTHTSASPMSQDPDWAGGTIYEDIQEVTTSASPTAVFTTVSGVGGARGWYVANPLWAIRGWLDKIIGGVGMRRGRRHPDELRVGDALDFFRVEAHEPPGLLRLRAEMKVPGDAWLEWRITEISDGGARLRQLARFHPRGVTGRAYWWILLPIHKIMWKQLAQRLVASAEASTSEARRSSWHERAQGRRTGKLIDKLKGRVVGSTTALFSHGPQPLANTLTYGDDPGLLGPDSVSWEVIGDVTAFVGGIRALVVQTAHPEVVAGVEQHSQYRTDPLGRLSRTSVYVTETTYGAMPEVEAAVATVRKAHIPVRGVSERDKPYSAGQPAMAAWVHNVLTDSFLVAFQTYGPRTLTSDEADQFVAEQARIGALLGADPLPATADELSRWISEHPALAPTRAQDQAIDFLRNPPLPVAVKLGYRLLFNAALTTVPANISQLIDLTPRRRGEAAGRRSVAALRWALGSSPSWQLALVRVGARVPAGRFRHDGSRFGSIGPMAPG